MTRLLFIRHGAIDGLGMRIAGRGAGNSLNRTGETQAVSLARRLRATPLSAIYTSPQPRTMETARALAAETGSAVHVLAALDEIDFGDWTGCTYDELSQSAKWRAFNTLRSTTRIPNGELVLEVQTRVVACAERLCSLHPSESVALVSHGDVIRAALAYYLGMPLEFMPRIEISPASVSTVDLSDSGPRVLGVNHTLPEASDGAILP